MSKGNSIDTRVSNQEKPVTICQKHNLPIYGDNPKRNKGRGCVRCFIKTMLNETKGFKEKARIKHGEKYDYSKAKIICKTDKVAIICPKHGLFYQYANFHIRGSGCPKCAYCSNGYYGYTKQNFVDIAKGRVAILYIIKCFLDNELFYKVGITYRSVQERFSGYEKMPYNYEIVKEIKGEGEKIFDLENYFHKKLKKVRYKPKEFFVGHSECFINLIAIKSDLDMY